MKNKLGVKANMRYGLFRRNIGFTLVELLVILTIMGIISLMAVPAIIKNMKKFETEQVASDVQVFFVRSRQNTMIYQNTLTLCIINNTNQCIKNHGNTLISFDDKDNDQTFDNSETVYEKIDVNSKYGYLETNANGRNYFKLKAEGGRPIGFMGHIKYCPTDNDTARMFKVTFNKVGIIKIKKNSEESTDCPS